MKTVHLKFILTAATLWVSVQGVYASEDPIKVAEEFVIAMRSRDYKKAEKLSADTLQERISSTRKELTQKAKESDLPLLILPIQWKKQHYEVLQQDDKTARVFIHMKLLNMQSDYSIKETDLKMEVSLIQRNGHWLAVAIEEKQ